MVAPLLGPTLGLMALTLGGHYHIKGALADATRRPLARFFALRLMPEVGFYDMASADLGAGLFITMMIIVFAPKTAGVLDLLLDPAQRRAYGGVGAILRSAAAALIFSLFLGPVAALHETAFMIGLLFGKRIRWSGQQRDAEGLSFAEAARVGALPTVVGALFLALLVARAPAVIPFALPVLLGWGLAIPFAWITASPRLGAWMARMGLAAIPEERTRVREVDAVLGERPAPAPRPVGIPAAVSGLTGSR